MSAGARQLEKRDHECGDDADGGCRDDVPGNFFAAGKWLKQIGLTISAVEATAAARAVANGLRRVGLKAGVAFSTIHARSLLWLRRRLRGGDGHGGEWNRPVSEKTEYGPSFVPLSEMVLNDLRWMVTAHSLPGVICLVDGS